VLCELSRVVPQPSDGRPATHEAILIRLLQRLSFVYAKVVHPAWAALDVIVVFGATSCSCASGNMHLGSGNERVRTGEARGGRGSDPALRDLHTRFQRVTRRFLASRPNRRRRYPLAPAGVAVALVVATATLLHWPQDQTVSSFISSVGSFGSGVRVVDGDTIDAVVPPGRDRRRYRLAGFDTPETYYARCDAERALGDRATRRLQELVRRDDVRIEVHGEATGMAAGSRLCAPTVRTSA
jgi:hypothetical protein